MSPTFSYLLCVRTAVWRMENYNLLHRTASFVSLILCLFLGVANRETKSKVKEK